MKKYKSLDKKLKVYESDIAEYSAYVDADVAKKHITNAHRKLKNKLYVTARWHKNHGDGAILVRGEVIKLIDEVFLEEFGEKLVEVGE